MKSAANYVLQNVNITFFVSYADALSLFIRQHYLDNMFHPPSKRFAVLYIHSSKEVFGTYDIIEGDVVCRNSRDLNIHDDCLRSNIEQFIQDCFGETVWTKYRHTHPYHHHRLCSDFEDIVFNCTSENITLESAHLINHAKQFHTMTVQGMIAQLQSRHVTFNENHSALVIPSNVVQQISEVVFNKMTCDLCNVITESNRHEYLTLYIAGERLKHQHFREHLRRHLEVAKSDIKRYLMPKEGSTYESNFTFGYTSTTRFDKEKHLDEMKICVDVNGEDETVMWLFNILIKKGEKIYSGLNIIWNERASFCSNHRKHSKHQVLLFRSKLNAPCYINDESCQLVATLEIKPPPEGWPDKVNFHYSLVITDNGPRIDATDLISERQHTAELIETTFNLAANFLDEATAPVLKGALSFSPNSFVRKARYSYGVMLDSCTSHGDCLDHLRIIINSNDSKMSRTFHKIIEKGQLLHHQQVFSLEFDVIVLPYDTPLWTSDGLPIFYPLTWDLELFRSSPKDPRLNGRPEDDQCKWITYVYNIPVDGVNDTIRYELKVVVKDIGLEFVVTRMNTKGKWKQIVEL